VRGDGAVGVCETSQQHQIGALPADYGADAAYVAAKMSEELQLQS